MCTCLPAVLSVASRYHKKPLSQTFKKYRNNYFSRRVLYGSKTIMCLYVCVCILMFVCTYICMYVCMYVCTLENVQACKDLCM